MLMEIVMAWVFLVMAGICEMIWPLGFKYTDGFTTRWWAVAGTFAVMLLSFGLMSQATRLGIAVGTTYAVWTGLGATGTVVLGMLIFDEPRDVGRLICLTLIIGGVVGLKVLSPESGGPPAGTQAVKTE
jgi:quaternary ammonium compound-resistance protein SugE